MSGQLGVPPVELYQVGELFFVRDGNHRVSVARSRGDATIQAYVTHVDAPFPVQADSAQELSAWLTEAGYRLFMSRTNLQEYHPDVDLRLTEPGRTHEFDEQIDVHRYFMGVTQQQEISYAEAVQSWYENVFAPLAQVIRDSGILKEFPRRTVADVYLWICQHREELKEQYNLDLSAEAAVSTFASVHSEKPFSKAIKNARLAVARMAAGDSVIIGLPRQVTDDRTGDNGDGRACQRKRRINQSRPSNEHHTHRAHLGFMPVRPIYSWGHTTLVRRSFFIGRILCFNCREAAGSQ